MPTLRDLRESNYISRSELARLAGVSQSTIVRMEEPDAETHTRQDIAEKVLEALGERIGQKITINDVEGLKLYNIMRDRKQRTKKSKDAA